MMPEVGSALTFTRMLSLSLALPLAVVASLSELVAAAPSATFAAATPLLARLSSLLPALHSAHDGPAVDSLLQLIAAALAQVRPAAGSPHLCAAVLLVLVFPALLAHAHARRGMRRPDARSRA